MKPYQTLATLLSTVTGRLTVTSNHRRSGFLEANPRLHALLLEHPELEHPEILLTELPKEAAFSSVTDQDLLLTR
ncbi:MULTISPECIES: hypothetical protein [Trichocoleus]|uniref:Uncharacterized protein n=1 Tax=Trichocoleus desertorum GB2-A4 TaxID=2933944 RepID=A0ABV0J5H0_9CYAN|nr:MULTISPECIES: hypothetical protein [unclassified Trichocoleus]MBD1863859.1 hypothetical protein [Trichocoleus sp. FACHB-46]MBD2095405.1 hypothetical protein [Trichocoleus sp. FACHB-591]